MWEDLGRFFAENQWIGWFSAAALLGIAEMMSLDLVLLMLALGAAGGGLAALLGAPFWLSLLMAVVISVGTLALVRPPMVARLHRGPELVSGHAALVGATAVVVDEVTDVSGRVKLSGELWTARAYDPNEIIEPGRKVRVFEIDGATAVVHPD
jgi:membrane protein implicated in regulation of membrane protease activity